MGTFGTHTLRIANKSTPSECSTPGFSQTACGFVLEFADIITTQIMNPSGEYQGNTYAYGWNTGGWPACEIQTYVNSDIYNALPSELKNGIINTTVVSGHGSVDSVNFTSTDKLYLLSPHEIFEDVDGKPNAGMDYFDKSYGNTRQLDYYSIQGVTTNNYSRCIKQRNGSNYQWWLRSALSSSSSNFYCVHASGYATNATARSTYGVSPAFRIG